METLASSVSNRYSRLGDRLSRDRRSVLQFLGEELRLVPFLPGVGQRSRCIGQVGSVPLEPANRRDRHG